VPPKGYQDVDVLKQKGEEGERRAVARWDFGQEGEDEKEEKKG